MKKELCFCCFYEERIFLAYVDIFIRLKDHANGYNNESGNANVPETSLVVEILTSFITLIYILKFIFI